ncbi:MAG: pseudouridine synthase [Rikenellaceae bacterium]|nr:pseudouridine synthase [Rikenellaceae bacterium]
MKRINKYITDAGYCSRREADAYIAQGRVTINGREAVLGDMVGDMDSVEVDGERVGRRKKPPIYIACNKPVGVTCTSERSDKSNIIDFLGYKERIFPVGRLDKDSEGLILLTNDGDIVNKILRAGNNNPKEYIVTVDKPVTESFLKEMAAGVKILGVRTKPCRIFKKNNTTFVIHLTQGLNRQIRRMCQALGYRVVRLKRIRVINITLGSLEPGRWRYLTPEEVREMHMLLAGSSGTEEASDLKKAVKIRGYAEKKKGSFSQYRERGNTGTRRSGNSRPRNRRKSTKA